MLLLFLLFFIIHVVDVYVDVFYVDSYADVDVGVNLVVVVNVYVYIDVDAEVWNLCRCWCLWNVVVDVHTVDAFVDANRIVTAVIA